MAKDQARDELDNDDAAVKEPTHVAQARNELANGLATGNTDSVESARKRLNAAGLDGDDIVAKATKANTAASSREAKAEAAADRRAGVQADVDKAKAEAAAREASDAAAREAEAAAKGATPQGRQTPGDAKGSKT